jgi:hypothetical protein
MSKDVEIIVILPTMTVAEIAQLCEQYNGYVRIEGQVNHVRRTHRTRSLLRDGEDGEHRR